MPTRRSERRHTGDVDPHPATPRQNGSCFREAQFAADVPTSAFAAVETRRQSQWHRDGDRLQKVDGQCCGDDVVLQQARQMSEPFVECACSPPSVRPAGTAFIACWAAKFVDGGVHTIESLCLETQPAQPRLETRPAQCDATGSTRGFLELMRFVHAVKRPFRAKSAYGTAQINRAMFCVRYVVVPARTRTRNRRRRPPRRRARLLRGSGAGSGACWTVRRM